MALRSKPRQMHLGFEIDKRLGDHVEVDALRLEPRLKVQRLAIALAVLGDKAEVEVRLDPRDRGQRLPRLDVEGEQRVFERLSLGHQILPHDLSRGLSGGSGDGEREESGQSET